MDKIPCDVRDLEKQEATIMMVDSNMYRSEILPSEKAFAYRMRLEAMKKQGKRTDLTSVPVAQKFEGRTSREILANEVGESQDNVRRYIRLTELTPFLLDMVDKRELSMRPAVEISYLPKEFQDVLADCMAMEACTPSHYQAIRMRKMFSENKLTADSIAEIMQEEKPNQKEKIVIRLDRAEKLIPKDVPVYKRNEYVLEALEYYSKHRQQGRAQQESHSERAKPSRSQDEWER